MLITRQATVTDAAWYRLKATGYSRRIGSKENPEAAGWPSSKWRVGGGSPAPAENIEPSEPVGTNYVSLTAGSERVFEGPFVPGDTVAFLRLVAGSTTHDIWEEPRA